jgi:SAM-dependent methyltransferase
VVTWNDVWRRRSVEDSDRSWIDRVLEADGYDAFGGVTATTYAAYVDEVSRTLQLSAGNSVFDVGCGAGAFLIRLADSGHPVGGIDIADALIAEARRAMPSGDFQVAEARDLAPTTQYDFVVSSSVFYYFPDLDYAAEVLHRMLRTATRAVAILDVPDLNKREEAEDMRRRSLGEETYAIRYDGLKHLYIDPEWFAEAAGARPRLFEPQHLQGYPHAPYRYNVYIQTSSSCDG